MLEDVLEIATIILISAGVGWALYFNLVLPYYG